MKELILACAGFVIEGVVFYAAGSVVSRILKLKADRTLTFIVGYLAYFSVFELMIVPMTLKWVSLTTAGRIWAVLMVLCVMAAFFLGKKNEKDKWRSNLQKVWENHSIMLAVAGIAIVVQCLIVIFYQDTTLDATYYVGNVSTSVYTDTLARYNPYNGVILKKFKARYIFSAYPMNNAVWCRLLGIHPLVQTKTVMSCINVITANLIIYQIGKKMFEDDRKKADLMVVFVCIMQLFSGTIYSAGTFFFTRSYEGKTLLANIAIPMVLLCALWLLREKTSRNVWAVLFLTAVSALTFSGSAIIFPVAIAAGMIPVVLWNRKFSGLFYCGLCMLPSVAYAIVFFATKLKWLTLAAS
ncbi:DUF6077 domain-containing protein [Blautia sp. MSJ-19]|uniref:DUF6077 domain-containing protein n=1 Tax=Blautia sp. MSJ-19 TaxID=2841517 RepID=UPI001C0EDABF|nr:DUF6077 domain-containing protein [Blautia sp. MSJ-19]MBU5482326.1 hypothetical protein [Blautia sp. MSJ-19]